MKKLILFLSLVSCALAQPANVQKTISNNEITGSLTIGTGKTLTVNTSMVFADDIKQTFNPGATVEGLNVGSLSGDPSGPANGGIWYDTGTNKLRARQNGTNTDLIAGSPGGSTTQVQYNNAGAFAGSADFIYASSVLTANNALAANTSGDGFVLSNSTAATAANQRYSSRLVLDGQGWKTTATAGSQDVRFAFETQPVQGTTNPTGNLVVSSNINAGGYTPRLTLTDAGVLYLGTTTAANISSSSGQLSLTSLGSNQNVLLTGSGTGFIASASNFLIGDLTANTTTADRYMNVVGAGAVFKAVRTGSGAATVELISRTTVNAGSDIAYWDFFVNSNASSLDDFTLRRRTGGANQVIFTAATGKLTIGPNTSSSSTSTGSLVNTGGLGNAGNAYIGGLLNVTGDVQVSKTITAAGTTGARTINNSSGSVNFAAAATSLVVTNSLVTANSVIICTVAANDTTMKSVATTQTSGSFTMFSNAAATAETRVNFLVTN